MRLTSSWATVGRFDQRFAGICLVTLVWETLVGHLKAGQPLQGSEANNKLTRRRQAKIRVRPSVCLRPIVSLVHSLFTYVKEIISWNGELLRGNIKSCSEMHMC